MCGRYQFTVEQSEEARRIADAINARYGADAWKPGEIFPSMPAPVLLVSTGTIQPELVTWGYRGQTNLIINVRVETAAEKPMFRESVERRRCVVPSCGFFEWDKQKRKYLFTLPGGNALYMAGLYDVRAGQRGYVILTTDANASMQEVHHRMPLVLTKEQIAPWLTESGATRDFLRMTPPMLEKVSADEQISLW